MGGAKRWHCITENQSSYPIVMKIQLNMKNKNVFFSRPAISNKSPKCLNYGSLYEFFTIEVPSTYDHIINE